MRIEIEDVLGDELAAVDGHHLGDSLIRFRLARPRLLPPYHRFIREGGTDPAALFPSAPNRAGIEQALHDVRRRIAETLAEQRDRPLLRAAGIETADDLLRFNEDHLCRPDWLYTNGQAIASVVERSPALFEAIVHPSLLEYLRFASAYGAPPLPEPGRGARFSSRTATESWIGQQLAPFALKCLPVACGGERGIAFLREAGVLHRGGRRVTTFFVHHRGVPRKERVEGEEPFAFLNRLDLDGFRPRCCATCAQFRFSAMSRDMSGGATGYCERRREDPQARMPDDALVSVFDSCALHERGQPESAGEER